MERMPGRKVMMPGDQGDLYTDVLCLGNLHGIMGNPNKLANIGFGNY
jgi:hypothetical protein